MMRRVGEGGREKDQEQEEMHISWECELSEDSRKTPSVDEQQSKRWSWNAAYLWAGRGSVLNA